MDLTICSNCGCNLTRDDDELSPYILTIQVPSSDGLHKDTNQYQLCKCCAVGIDTILEENEQSLLNMHGQTCGDILPTEYRCVHSVARPGC